MPDDAKTVLVHIRSADDLVWLAYRGSKSFGWRLLGGEPLPSTDVIEWADMPKGSFNR